jgi:hypothetical protein
MTMELTDEFKANVSVGCSSRGPFKWDMAHAKRPIAEIARVVRLTRPTVYAVLKKGPSKQQAAKLGGASGSLREGE